MSRIAFIGLGTMGANMAAHLAAKGHDVTVYNRTKAKAEAWVNQHGGSMMLSPREAAKDAEFIITCVGNDDDLRAVLISESGALAGATRNAVVIDHTTASAEVARELAECAHHRGLDFLDAPVSGGQRGAEEGILSVMVGGDPDCFAKAKPIMSAYAKSVVLMGTSGAGQLTKMVNQICIAGLIQGLSEALAFGQRAGLDMEKALDVISHGAAGSWQLNNRGKTMLANQFNFGFAVDWMRKDLGLCLKEAERINASLPVTVLVDQFYADIQAQGGGRLDTSSLIKRLSNL